MNRLLNSFFSMFVLVGCMLMFTACPSGEDPYITLGASELTFESAENSEKTLKVETNTNWSVIYQPTWLQVSPSSGDASTTSVTLKTTSSNQTGEKLSDIVSFEAGDATAKVSVAQETESPYTLVTPVNPVIMSYGYACSFTAESNVMSYKVNVVTETEAALRTDAQIEDEARSWTNHYSAADKNVLFAYNECEPDSRYMLIIVSYDSKGKRGIIKREPFTTASLNAQPVANVVEFKVKENQFALFGNQYEWTVELSGNCAKYYTYACVSDKKFPTYELAEKVAASDSLRRGYELAQMMRTEMLADESDTHTPKTFHNLERDMMGRETFFLPYVQRDRFHLDADLNHDKYLEIFTWCVDANGNLSGIVCDRIYEIKDNPNPTPDNPTIIVEVGRDEYGSDKPINPGNTDPTYTFDVDKNSISVAGSSSSQNFHISGSDSWTVSSNQNWCRVSPTNGSGSSTVTVTIDKNSSSSSRSATITVQSGHCGTKYITVSQNGSGSSNVGRDEYSGDIQIKPEQTGYTLQPNFTSLQFSSASGYKSVTITSNQGWTASSNASWCTVSPASGSNDGTITVSVNKNSGSSARQAVISLKGKNDNRTVSIMVNQDKGGASSVGRDEYGSDKHL